MGRNDCRKPADMGGPGELVEISGNAFELRHEIQMFPAHPFTHSPAPDKLPNDLGRTAARCPG